jgi:hypothetical protein
MTIRRIALCAALIALLVSPVRGQEEVATMTVTNGGSVVNGNTTSFETLSATPGSDGISFAEAVEASNGTAGPKLIKFAPELVRNPIEVVPDGSDRRLLVLTSGRLTIDGDVDGDGKPDITLVAPITASSAAVVIRSSRNTIRGLNFVTFPDAAIVFTCLDAACEERGIVGTRIENNTFFSPRGAGINVAPAGIRPVDVPYVTDVTFDGLTIANRLRRAAACDRPQHHHHQQ